MFAGDLCVKCCGLFWDNCGIDEPQGDVMTLHEFDAGDYPAIFGHNGDN